jgi:hypothetical protein
MMHKTGSISFERFLLQRVAVSPQQIRAALDAQRHSTPFVGTLAVDGGLMSVAQLLEVLDALATHNGHFGDVAIEMGFLTPEQRQNLLVQQRTIAPPLGEILVKQGALSQKRMLAYLSEYMGLQESATSEKASWRPPDVLEELRYTST